MNTVTHVAQQAKLNPDTLRALLPRLTTPVLAAAREDAAHHLPRAQPTPTLDSLAQQTGLSATHLARTLTLLRRDVLADLRAELAHGHA